MAKGWGVVRHTSIAPTMRAGLMVSKTGFFGGLFLYVKSSQQKRIFIERGQPSLAKNRFVVEDHFSGKRRDSVVVLIETSYLRFANRKRRAIHLLLIIFQSDE